MVRHLVPHIPRKPLRQDVWSGAPPSGSAPATVHAPSRQSVIAWAPPAPSASVQVARGPPAAWPIREHDAQDTCHVCGKHFHRRANLLAHVRTHSDPSFKCSHCPASYASAEALVEHVRERHILQSGGGGSQGGVADMYSLVRTAVTEIPRFATTKKQYHFNIVREIQPDENMLQMLGDILGSMLDEVTADGGMDRLYALCLQHPRLDYPIATPTRALSDL